MLAKDIMSRRVISVEPDAAVVHAVRLMLQHRISGLPVIQPDGQMVGILSEGDLLRRVEHGTQRKRPRWLEFIVGPGQLAGEYVRAAGGKVRDVMTERVQTVDEDASLEEVVERLERYGIKRLPVVKDGKVVGIITRAIFCMRLRRSPPRPNRRRVRTKRSVLRCSRSSTSSPGRPRASSISWCATGSWVCGARSSMSGSARRCWSRRRTRPGSRAWKII